MNQDVKAKWLEALRSDEYKQGFGCLSEGTDQKCFCCLGVLVDLYIKEHGLEWKILDDGPHFFDNSTVLIGPTVQKWAGLTSSNPLVNCDGKRCELSVLNDIHLFDFNKIADIIEENL